MAIVLNLEKAAKSLVLSLEKAGVTTPPVLEVGIGMDVSGSFMDEHEAGITDVLLTRLVPWGLAFDPDRKLDVFTFSDGAKHVQRVGAVDETNYQGFVPERIVGKVDGYGGGTDYSFLLESMLTHFGWKEATIKKAPPRFLRSLPPEGAPFALGRPGGKKPGFLGRLLGARDQVIGGEKKRSVIFIITDGDNSDKARTIKVLKESEARHDQVYFQFLGISNQGSTFPFLKSIGNEFSNTGFLGIKNLRKFIKMSDEELNEQLVTEELLAWFKESR